MDRLGMPAGHLMQNTQSGCEYQTFEARVGARRYTGVPYEQDQMRIQVRGAIPRAPLVLGFTVRAKNTAAAVAQDA